jgi:hypothetical protein
MPLLLEKKLTTALMAKLLAFDGHVVDLCGARRDDDLRRRSANKRFDETRLQTNSWAFLTNRTGERYTNCAECFGNGHINITLDQAQTCSQ